MLAVLVIATLAACGGGGGGGGGSGGSNAPVATAPTITSQPQAQSVRDGQPASFVVVASGTAPLTYQWLRAGQPVSGANGATLAIASATLADSGSSFSVSVTNAGGSITSANATLTVVSAAPTLSIDAPRTIVVLEGATASLSVNATGSNPLAFQWRRNGLAIAGATAATYVTPAVTLSDQGAAFDVVVSNLAGSVQSATTTLSVTPVPVAPSITTAPQATTVRTGETAVLNVAATGTAPLSYQWMRDGVSIDGARSSTFALTGAMLQDNGARFTVAVTNTVGSATSAEATLTVLPQAGIALVAGNIGGPGYVDAVGTTARLTRPSNVAIDQANNVYFVDGSAVRKIDASGAVTTIAGSTTARGNVDGPASTARFDTLNAITVDASGTLFVADLGAIRRISASGVVSTYVGSQFFAGSMDDPTGNGLALFNLPMGLATDAQGNVYVADTLNNTIRKVTPARVVSTLAGSATASGSADGTGSAARFNAPRNVVVDPANNVYVTDGANHTLRVVSPAGVVTTLAGSAGVAGSADGSGGAARFDQPSGIALDGTGNLYVAELGGLTIRKVTSSGIVTTVAGSAGVSGAADGIGTSARFAKPVGLASNAAGALVVADQDNFAIRQVGASASVTTLAGAAVASGSVDGTGAAARFAGPVAVAVDAASNVYVADATNAVVRKISAAGVVTTLAGTAGSFGSNDGTGAAARFARPQAVAVDSTGNVFVADKDNHTIRKITATGVVTTLAGRAGVQGSSDGIGSAATFNSPAGIAVDASGNVYVSDNGTVIRKITPGAVVTTFAGVAGAIGADDNTGSGARFNDPRGLATDASGNVYVADTGNFKVRKITAARVVTTLAGSGAGTGDDGTTFGASFLSPVGVAIGTGGDVYVSDSPRHTIRLVDTGHGIVGTIVGVADGVRGVKLGALPGHLDLPMGIATDINGNLYVVDSNGVLRVTLR